MDPRFESDQVYQNTFRELLELPIPEVFGGEYMVKYNAAREGATAAQLIFEAQVESGKSYDEAKEAAKSAAHAARASFIVQKVREEPAVRARMEAKRAKRAEIIKSLSLKDQLHIAMNPITNDFTKIIDKAGEDAFAEKMAEIEAAAKPPAGGRRKTRNRKNKNRKSRRSRN